MERNKTKTAGHEALTTMAVLAMAGIFFGLLSGAKALYVLALLLLAVGVFMERWSIRVSSGWLKFAGLLSAVNTRVILGLIFFLFLTPISLLYRMFHGDFLGLKKGDGKTYFSGRDHSYHAGDLTNPW
ncbi:MAG TPA: hypothetical protein VGJ94_17155 [Syntrophorhabdaceae bacterium]|jgi:uncharacterized membrane protein